ncbi:MAG: autotransporter outer membrane beta-barrel domain-containing protein [Thiotrichales bacterium]|nr:autotransporter outer membrane beta-barrel domain-containing protein [Thiotrichales bacterium]
MQLSDTQCPHGEGSRIFSFRRYIYLCLLLIGMVSLRTAGATEPNVLGTYVGTVTFNETVCVPPPAGGIESANVSMTISSQNGGNFSGNGVIVFPDDGETDTFTFSGMVDALGNVTGGNINATAQDGSTSSATFTGSINNDLFNINAAGSDLTGSPLCNFTIVGTLKKTGDDDLVVNPAVTPGSTLTTPILFSTQVDATTSDLGVRIGDALRSSDVGFARTGTGLMYQSSGMNAGDHSIPYGLWISYSYSDFDNDLSSTAFDGTRHGVLAGVDFSPWENSVLGVAVGYEYSDIDTDFNEGEQETDGFTIAPYFGYLLTDTWSIDLSFGYSEVESDQFRTLPGTTTRVSSSPDTTRWFASGNLNGWTQYNNWTFGFSTGILRAKSTQDSFVESNGTFNLTRKDELGQWRVRGDVSYSYNEFEPFLGLTYHRDFKATDIVVLTGPQPENDRDDFLLNLGVRYFSRYGITGNLEWSKRFDRADFDEDTINLTIRSDF